jgi:hypothetical protein
MPHRRVGFPKRTFLAVLLMIGACVHPHLQNVECGSLWEPARTLQLSDTQPAYAEAPAAVETPNGIMLLGVPSFLWASRDTFDIPPSAGTLDTATYIARLRANHGLVGFLLDTTLRTSVMRPWFSGPAHRFVTARGRDGVVHVVWIAPRQLPDTTENDAVVWYSEYSATGWTEPRILFSADLLDWTGEMPSLLVREAGSNSPEIHVFVPYTEKGRSRGIAYIRRIAGKWLVSENRLRGLPARVTAQFLGQDSVVVIYAAVGYVGARERNGQHLFMLRAAITDTAWREGSLLAWSGLNNIRWARLFRLSADGQQSGRLILAWLPARFDSASSDTVFAQVSTDFARTWAPRVALTVPFRVGTVAAAIDGTDELHLVLSPQTYSAKSASSFMHASIRNGRWTTPKMLAFGPAASTPTLASISERGLLLTWGSANIANSGSPGAVAPVTRYSFFRRSCDR